MGVSRPFVKAARASRPFVVGASGWLAVGLLGVPASATLARAAWAVVQPVGLDYAEPVVYGQAMRVAAGQALYQAVDQLPYTVAAYTPLYYWLAAALQAGVGPGWWPGRLLSLVAGTATALLVATLAAQPEGGQPDDERREGERHEGGRHEGGQPDDERRDDEQREGERRDDEQREGGGQHEDGGQRYDERREGERQVDEQREDGGQREEGGQRYDERREGERQDDERREGERVGWGGDGWWVGGLAGLAFLALGFPEDVPWLGLYRVDMLGVALSVAAIALLSWHSAGPTLLSGRSGGPTLLSWHSAGPTLVAAGVLAGLALLTKQTFLAALVAGTLWQIRDRPTSALVFCAVALATCCLPCLALVATTGGAFVENTLLANVNPFAPAIAEGLLPTFLASQWLPLLLAGSYLIVGRPWRRRQSRLLVLYWVISSVWLLGIAKVGANANYWIEFAAATAILAARGAVCLLRSSPRPLALVAGVGLLLAVGIQLGGPSGVLTSLRGVRTSIAATRAPPLHAEFDTLVDRVRHAPGEVLAEPMDVLVLADRPVLLEPFIYNLLLSAGQWQPEPLVARICHGDIGLLVLAYPLDVGAHMTDGLYALWPAPIMAALQDSMALDSIQARRYVYAYAPSRTPASACP
jgi:hypothetical protein